MYSIYTKTFAVAGLLVLLPIYAFVRKRQTHLSPTADAPYAAWLTFLVYLYLILTPVLAFEENLPAGNLSSIRFFGLMIYARLVLQAVLVLWVKKWSPLIGISYNLFCLFQFSYLFTVYAEDFHTEAVTYHSSSLFLAIVVSSLVVDSVYALLYYRNNTVDRKLMIALNFLHAAALLLLLMSFFF
ncbi:hypothetical protein FVR03_02880 [Pontibacter qinzhouensis]|uniref:Uncharacterized protein n=1 Tax=Pontibacter qinzhouensis TaxID=2603253 RepID=A0A5C8KEM7_9BACT|nr:hypothetical protein [Pontibacter qinzhouensis]TXK51896.1 hypothetical protein FVR03_02880 [Pontibacter qinzhouensis]